MTSIRKKPQAPEKAPARSSADFHEKLAESLLDDPKIIKSHAFSLCSGTPDGRSALRGILIPYFDMKGRQIKEFWRYRYLEDTRKGFERLTAKKPQRYTQPKGKAPRAYFSPSVDWIALAANPEETLVVTEGEFKSACACEQGFPTVGLGGVWNFTQHRNQTRELMEDLKAFEWSGRDVVVCYDSDAVHNDLVRKAEFRIADMLSTFGAHVRVARLPSLQDGRKCGLDDYLAHKDFGPEAFSELLARAEPFAELEALYRLNLELAVVMNPVCYYVKYSHEPQGYLQKLDVGTVRAQKDMAEALATKFILQPGPKKKDGSEGPMVQTPLFLRWYHWEGRTTAKRMSYIPGAAGMNGELLNTWGGWGVDPVTDEQLAGKPLDVDPWLSLLDTVFEGSEPEHRRWFDNWLAYQFQHPGVKMSSCVILSSKVHGVGKSFVQEILARIHGRGGDPYVGKCLNGNEHVNASKIDLMGLTSGRNDWARGRTFVFGEDVRGTTSQESREIRDQLKDAITRTTVRIDEKYMKPIEFEDRCNFIFSTNDPTVFQMDDEDRRFFVVESHAAAPKPYEFYDKVDEWSKTHGPAHLHRWLLEYKLDKDFKPNTRPPMTDVKADILEANATWLDQWCRDLRNAPDRILSGGYGLPVRKLYSQEDLLKILDPDDAKKISKNVMGRALRMERIPATKLVRLPDGRQRILYAPKGFADLPTGLVELGKYYSEERGESVKPEKEVQGVKFARKKK